MKELCDKCGTRRKTFVYQRKATYKEVNNGSPPVVRVNLCNKCKPLKRV